MMGNSEWASGGISVTAPPGNTIIEFGFGRVVVVVGRYDLRPAVFIIPAKNPGVPGDRADREEYLKDALAPGEMVLTFPTKAQAQAVKILLTSALQFEDVS